MDQVMNQLNEQLRIIKNQKKVYHQQCKVAENENNMQELYKLSKKIFVLNKEEQRILKELNRGEL